jgi:hypothetical protein
VLAAIVAAASVVAGQGRATWMREARLGVMTHYLADWRSRTDHVPMTLETWNQLVDEFDVDGLAAQLASAGVKYSKAFLDQLTAIGASVNRSVSAKPLALVAAEHR